MNGKKDSMQLQNNEENVENSEKYIQKQLELYLKR